jgi:hypothetical protein
MSYNELTKLENMQKFVFILLILLAACAPVSAPQPSSAQGGSNNPTAPVAQPASPLPSNPENPTQPSSGEAATAQTPLENANGALWVRVISHQDGDTVNTPVITLKGQAPADAVVTVNDEIILVSQDQTFETQVKLDEGPNLIEIVASDVNGNEVYLPFTIEYEL